MYLSDVVLSLQHIEIFLLYRNCITNFIFYLHFSLFYDSVIFRPIISFILAMSTSFSIGFRIKQLAGNEENIPESSQEYISPAVRKQTLTFLSNLLISWYKEKPFSFGILISRITKLYQSALNFSNAIRGSSYESTTNPFSPKTFSGTKQISDSSS